MSQNIEFYLQPPSPTGSHTSLPRIHSGDKNTNIQLPSVSSILPISTSPSISSISSYHSSYLPTLNLPSSPDSNSSETTSLPSLSPFMGSLSLVDSPPQSFNRLLLPPPTNTRRCRSLSNASSIATTTSIHSFHSCHDPTLYDDNEEVPFMQKRKRGRPPNNSSIVRQGSSSSNNKRDSWTFVTPTVWDVKQHEEKEEINNNNEDYLVLHWPTQQQQQQQGQNTFTNTKMDTTLSMPKKKRGRKPKMQLAGNFCFVWRDLTQRRGANKKSSIVKSSSK